MSERVGRLLSAFNAAMAASNQLEQERVLRDSCAGDVAMLAELRGLLASEPPAGFLVPQDLPRWHGQMPRQIANFELLHEIGCGGASTVWLARDATLGRDVAIKVMTAGPGTPQSQIDRFHREARAAARLAHPHIVPVLAEGQAGDNHWFAMQFVDGHGLDVELRLQRHRAPSDPGPLLPPFGSGAWFAAVARIAADAADALHAAHRAGIVHRDVKPANLLLTREARVLVADFGIARDDRFGTLTDPGLIAGTWHYMSPEQARVTRAPVDHRTDVYSLGVVLYELLTRHRPYEGKTSLEVVDRIRNTSPLPVRSLVRNVPRDLETICMAAMAHRPEARYQNAGELAADLRRFLGHEAILQRSPTRLSRAVRFAVRHRRKLCTTVAVLAAMWVGLRLNSYFGVSLRAAGVAPVGVIAVFAADKIPDGWKECNGDVLKAADYPALSTILGSTYGQVGAGNVKLPDFRGYFLRVADGRHREGFEAIEFANAANGIPKSICAVPEDVAFWSHAPSSIKRWVSSIAPVEVGDVVMASAEGACSVLACSQSPSESGDVAISQEGSNRESPQNPGTQNEIYAVKWVIRVR